MRDLDAVLAVNAEFYAAFTERDYEAMESLWARISPVACIHPGWPPISGRDEVMVSWQQILGNAGAPKVECVSPEPFLCGDAIFVICYERIDDALLAATNVFVREDGIWKMVHHQAGPTSGEPEAAPRSSVGTIH
ncbi:MAG: nuclear transport factor 2 family protein [Alphaproteobacteria bacterium]|nr:nuclear transport factor 2 family protein [Alphaproteobacteria bacterium]